MTERLLKGETGRPFPKKHGLGGTRVYNIWKKMRYRCYNERDLSYKWYGARGIKICDRWLKSPLAFLEDMGPPPEGCSIERINVDGDYEPGNCIWLPHRYQSMNRRPWKHTEEGLEGIREARRRSKKED